MISETGSEYSHRVHKYNVRNITTSFLGFLAAIGRSRSDNVSNSVHLANCFGARQELVPYDWLFPHGCRLPAWKTQHLLKDNLQQEVTLRGRQSLVEDNL